MYFWQLNIINSVEHARTLAHTSTHTEAHHSSILHAHIHTERANTRSIERNLFVSSSNWHKLSHSVYMQRNATTRKNKKSRFSILFHLKAEFSRIWQLHKNNAQFVCASMGKRFNSKAHENDSTCGLCNFWLETNVLMTCVRVCVFSLVRFLLWFVETAQIRILYIG